MEFCNDPQGRQAKAPEQRYSVAIIALHIIK